jgi:DNA-directed RNA polymerase subunit RPC12/RpoP
MQVIEIEGGRIIKCQCGFIIFNKEGILRMRFAIIKNGYVCIKCPKCKRMDDSVSMEVFMK